MNRIVIDPAHRIGDVHAALREEFAADYSIDARPILSRFRAGTAVGNSKVMLFHERKFVLAVVYPLCWMRGGR